MGGYNMARKINITKQLTIGMSKAMGVAVDKSIFFPQTNYQKAHRTWWEKLIDWKVEMRERISTAVEVLQGKHYCSDEY